MGDRERDVGARAAVERAFTVNRGKIVAILTRDLRDLDLAEDAIQDAFAEALRTWPSRGSPSNPTAWIVTTARNRAIDRLRRAAAATEKLSAGLPPPASADDPVSDAVIEAVLHDDDLPDERARLIFTCCHPALARPDAVALTLRSVAGLTTPEIAAAFLVKDTTMQARITRAKAKIRRAGIPYRVPNHHELPDRLPAALDVILLVYGQGYAPGGPPSLAEPGPLVDRLRHRAIELAAVLADHLPDEPEAIGCHALLLFHEARQPARVDDQGELVALEDQDRTRWDRELAARAEPMLERALRIGRPGPFQLQAAISALHTTAPTADATDWPQIAVLYRQLLAVAPSPTTEIGHAVAVGMADGPAAGLAALPEPDPPLDRFHRWHAARADLLRRLGDVDAAVAAFATAAELATQPAEQRWLLLQAESLRPGR